MILDVPLPTYAITAHNLTGNEKTLYELDTS